MFCKWPLHGRLMLAGFNLGHWSVITAGLPEPTPRHPFHLRTPATNPEFHTYLQTAEWVSRDAGRVKSLLPDAHKPNPPSLPRSPLNPTHRCVQKSKHDPVEQPCMFLSTYQSLPEDLFSCLSLALPSLCHSTAPGAVEQGC